MNEKFKIKMVLAIVPRGVGESMVEFLRERLIFFNLLLLGKGTAASEWADFLALGDSKKDILITAVSAHRSPQILREMDEEFELSKPGRGIAFSVDISSVGGRRILDYWLSAQGEKENGL
jgi:hypothetical protein